MQRLKTRAQFEAAMAGGTVSRTVHFVLHRAAIDAPSSPPGPAPTREQALFAVQAPWIGVVLPKRWAKRAVTRNGIRRQVYALASEREASFPPAAHVVRLRTAFARDLFPSAWSETLKRTVREELQQLFAKASPTPSPRAPKP